jgi:hypothetical protein
MTTTERIADSYHSATLTEPWYGPSLAKILAQVSPDQAVKSLAPKANSISTILQHLLLWNERIRLASDANPMPKWEAEKDWSEPPIPWSDLLSRWNQSRNQLEDRIRKFPIPDLTTTVPGRTYSYEALFQGSVEHVIYHSAQIAMTIGALHRQAS